MIQVHISETLAERLKQIAQRENQSLDEVVERMLESQVEESAANDAPPGTLAALIQAADQADLHSGHTDTAESSRDILDSEYGDYLRNKYGLDKKTGSSE